MKLTFFTKEKKDIPFETNNVQPKKKIQTLVVLIISLNATSKITIRPKDALARQTYNVTNNRYAMRTYVVYEVYL